MNILSNRTTGSLDSAGLMATTHDTIGHCIGCTSALSARAAAAGVDACAVPAFVSPAGRVN